MKPAFKISSKPFLSSLVNPALPGLDFVVLLLCGFAKSISVCATFKSPQNITGFSFQVLAYEIKNLYSTHLIYNLICLNLFLNLGYKHLQYNDFQIPKLYTTFLIVFSIPSPL